MTIFQIIEKKANQQALDASEIKMMVDGFVIGTVKDYQMSSFMMAIYCNGLNDDELYYLCEAMIQSGAQIDLRTIGLYCVDKHSTGGVGDKVSLVLGGMLAANGLGFAKMSGRGLGHTGGTIDKLESISGFDVELDEDALKKQVQKIGLAIIGQSQEMVIADKLMYALRDVSATISSIPLIASSIMSKKIAAGASSILLDVKYGDGAFMSTPSQAIHLAQVMIRLGARFNRKVSAEISSMQQPLGYCIGNALEVEEAIQTLQGNGPDDLEEICVQSCAKLMVMANVEVDLEIAKEKAKLSLMNQTAYHKFMQMVNAQKGSECAIEKLKLRLQESSKIQVYAEKSGYIEKIYCKKLGELATQIKAGRIYKDDSLDYYAGFRLHKKVGDFIEARQLLCSIYSNQSTNMMQEVLDCFVITKEKVEKPLLLYRMIDE